MALRSLLRQFVFNNVLLAQPSHRYQPSLSLSNPYQVEAVRPLDEVGVRRVRLDGDAEAVASLLAEMVEDADALVDLSVGEGLPHVVAEAEAQ